MVMADVDPEVVAEVAVAEGPTGPWLGHADCVESHDSLSR